MRLRIRRALAACSAAAVAGVAVGGAVGLWPTGQPATGQYAPAAPANAEVMREADVPLKPMLAMVSAATRDVQGLVDGAHPAPAHQRTPALRRGGELVDEAAVPARSGRGRRVVFGISAQRVWLVGADGTAQRSYPVSGSRLDNLSPGSYEVYSTSRHATSYTLDETMGYMVRFTRGANAAIGFHDIPVDHEGEPVQTNEQLGEPLSSGCIRQRQRDAQALWKFAPVGTTVVVVA